MKLGKIPLSDYIITKQLTKAISEYKDSKGLPHVEVAKKQMAQGKNV